MQVERTRLLACLLLGGALVAAGASADDDHGDTAATATALTLGVAVSGRIDPGDDVDYFSLELAGTTDVIFATTGTLDTVGVLYDSDQREIANNDDGGAGSNFRIRRELAEGTYYLRVRGYSQRTGDYEVSAVVAAPDDHGDDRATATDLGLGTSIAGYLDPADVDYFRVEIAETTGAIFTTTGNLDLTGRLYDQDGRQLAYNDDNGNGRNFRIRVLLEPGTYFVEVKGIWGSTEGNYRVWAISDEWDDAVCDRYDDNMAPFFPAAGWPGGLQGFVRLVNRRNQRGFFDIEAIDDAGNSYDLTVALAAYESLHLDSEDIQYGNAAKGGLAGTGAAPETGHWRLCMPSSSFAYGVDQSAYVRTRDGFLTAMNGSIPGRRSYRACAFLGDDPARSNDCRYWKIPIFNPASNVGQASSLRIANNSGEPQRVGIVGYRGDGRRNRAGDDALFASGTVPARTSVTMTARQLETGSGLPLGDASGRIGPAAGTWDLEVWASENADFVVLNLMRSPSGRLTNLSGAVRQSYSYRGVPSAEARIAELKAVLDAKERAGVEADLERVHLFEQLGRELAQ